MRYEMKELGAEISTLIRSNNFREKIWGYRK